MGIESGDIVLAKSQVMDDVPEGGGAPVASTIADGTSNGIFNDVSEVDRAGGDVSMRKLFPSVRTPDREGYFGMNMIVARPPADPRVSVTLTPGGQFDRRAEAASRMEAYLAKGASYQGYLFGDHIAGQRNVALLQRPEVALPAVGDTLVLTKNFSLPNEYVQYIRITDVASIERTFSDSSGDFKRTMVTLDISDSLGADFPGFDALRYDASINFTAKTKINDTIVADAARYYGVVPLETPVGIGDYTVKATSIFTQLVPSTRIEVPIADARMNQQSATLAEAGAAYSRSLTLAFTTTQQLFVGGSILPGSLTIARGGVTLSDKGGLLLDASSAQVGTVDYANGVLSLSASVWGTAPGTHLVTYKPAYAPTLVSQSLAQVVTQEGQRLSWTLTLDPPPLRGTLQVSYRALGRWYVLMDDGSGALRGSDSAFGAGTLNMTTGTVSVTLGYLPDVESALVYTFVPSVVTRKVGDVPAAGPALPRAFGTILSLGKAIKPGTLSITWNDGSARTATDAGGVLTGDATGAISYGEGLINFRPNNLPAKDTAINVSITETAQQKATVGSFTDGGSTWNASLSAPLKAGSVELSIIGQYNLTEPASYWLARGAPQVKSYRLFDNGSGSLLMANIDSNIAVGTVNYSTGAITINKSISAFKVDGPKYAGALLGSENGRSVLQIGYQVTSPGLTVLSSGTGGSPGWAWWSGAQSNALEARYSGADASGYSASFTFSSIFLPNNAGVFSTTSGFAAKFASFFVGSAFYAFNQSTSQWVRDPLPTSGAGTNAGANAVVAGIAGVLLTAWPAGASSTPTDVAGATQPDTSGVGSLLSVDRATFRTAVSPLVNSGFNLAGNWSPTGASFSVSANSAGVISSGSAPVGETPGSFGVFGTVDYEMGLCTVAFGRRVPSSMAGGPLVIDISDLGLPGVTYIESIPVQSDTLRYNATGYSYLPLDPAILGLNPVRLPADGRVPIFRQGTFAVLSHSATLGPISSVTPGQVLDCARTRLSRIRVLGSDGTVIHTGYTVDLDLGTLTVVSASGWSFPITIEHWIEDMAMVSDAQINGQLSFTRQITHEYPVPGSYVSSALVTGDTRARTSVTFDQVSWTGVWQDSQIGGEATGEFNDAAHPIAVTNAGALTERWAVIFDNTTSFKVLGEHVGVIAIGNTGADCSPMNAEAGYPYFTLPSAGWGLGWAQGNVLRFNTVGANASVWATRTVLQGPETALSDKFVLLTRGDVDRP